MSKQKQRFESVLDYCRRTGTKRVTLMLVLKMSRFRIAGLLYPDRYPVALTRDEQERIAALLNQPLAHVQKLYPEVA